CVAFVGFLSSGLALWLFALPLANFLKTLSWLEFLSPSALTWLSILPVMTVFTLVLLVFGTLLPRKLAERNAEKIARRLRGFASFCNSLFLPMARLGNWMIRTIMHAMGLDPDEEIEKLTEDEIRLLVDVGEEKGAIEETEREMIENVFEFNNLTAADAMTHRTDVWAIWIEDSDQEITSMIEETGLSRFPVYDDDLDHIIGTVSTRDFLLNRLREHPKSLHEITRKARFVPDSVRTDVLFRDMQHNKYHMAIVVDEYGGTSGLITMEDLIEEIVGNIYDENDPQVQQDIIELGGGRYKVAGSVEIETFNEEASLDLPIEEDYDTIGGLILSELGSIPDEGSQPEINFQGLNLRVLSVIDRRIEWVEISPLEKEGEEQIV
ncbi:MAG: HlyC/CorC family transporter, partial [Clostridiales bacterium]|nr:HlyC/CorC family transporter [Clostridiales bacterium]